jgi:hypothetical protein
MPMSGVAVGGSDESCRRALRERHEREGWWVIDLIAFIPLRKLPIYVLVLCPRSSCTSSRLYVVKSN